MTRSIIALLGTVLLASLITPATAGNKLEQRVDTATNVLERFTRIPEQGIPPSLLRGAYGVAVIPNTIKAGFMLGGSFGQGILVVRKADGRWSNPTFINLGSGSFGFQAGAQSSDLILVFRTRRSVENIASGKVTLGGDASVAAGPVGRMTSASTDASMKAEIYSYSRNRGFFAGISIEGGVLAMDKRANRDFYKSSASAREILKDPHMPTPLQARRFQTMLGNTAPRVASRQKGSQTARGDSNYSSAPSSSSRQDSGVRTYGVEEAPATSGSSIY